LPSTHLTFLIVRAGALRCALPLSQVREVMRLLPIKAADGLLPGVLGATVVRGNPLPVVGLPQLLKQSSANVSRFVVVTTLGRECVLAVDHVEAISSLEEAEWQRMPNLLQQISSADEIAAVDRDLIVTLDMGRLMAALPEPEAAQ
jgi:purine-binding chemotaxis protein CheW